MGGRGEGGVGGRGCRILLNCNLPLLRFSLSSEEAVAAVQEEDEEPVLLGDIPSKRKDRTFGAASSPKGGVIARSTREKRLKDVISETANSVDFQLHPAHFRRVAKLQPITV